MVQIIATTENGDHVSLDILHGSTFALEMNQPFLDTERVPVPYSTNISLPPTTTNKRAFGYVPAYMLEPLIKEAEAVILLNGITIAIGVLTYAGIDDGNLQYAFAGKNMPDEWDRKIWDPTESLISTIETQYPASSARYPVGHIPIGEYISYPPIINKSFVDTPYAVGNIGGRYFNYNAYDAYSLALFPGYANGGRYLCPAFGIWQIVRHAVGGALEISSRLQTFLSGLRILGPYNTFLQGCYISDGPPPSSHDMTGEEYNRIGIKRIYNTLPDLTTGELFKNILYASGESLFRDGAGYVTKSWEDIVASSAFDLSYKISDIFSSSIEPAKNYALSYNEEDNGKMPHVTPSKYNSISQLLSATQTPGQDDNYHLVSHRTLGDVYSIDGYTHRFTNGRLSVGELKYRRPGAVPSGDKSTETFAIEISMTPVQCMPDMLPQRKYVAGGYSDDTVPRIHPVIDPIEADAERGKKAYIGRYKDYQMVDKGVIVNTANNSSDETIGESLTIDTLFSNHHTNFAEWMSKDHQVIKADLNLTAMELAELRLYNKALFANRYWLIKKISLTIEESGRIQTTGEFVSL